ncbi:MAG: peptide deformylase [Pikeienuella sp.]
MSDFLLWPNKRLTTIAEPVAAVDGEVIAIWQRMCAAMYAMPGVGLAAPQLGIPKRLAVVDCSDGAGEAILLANPELLQTSSETSDWEEASPNLPGVHAKVTRPATVQVRYLDASGAETTRWFEGLWATSVQHQIDHLNGMLYVDRLSRTKRRMVLDKYSKLRRRG